MKRLLSILIILTASTAAYAYSYLTPDEKVRMADSLRRELRHARTSTDSLPIICNLYDVLPRSLATPLGDTVVMTALRAGDPKMALFVIRNQASRYIRSDSMLNELQRITERYTAGEGRNETVTHINFMKNMRIARYGDTHDREKALRSYLEKLTNNPDADLYERISLTHGVCMMLSSDPDGEIAVGYMDSLANLINQTPPTDYSLRQVYNIHAAALFAHNQPLRSIEADRNNIKVIHDLEKFYAERGRPYRSFHTVYYDIYTRLLSNFKHLTPEEIDDYYHKMLIEVSQDPDVKTTHDELPLPDIYYAMAHKDYKRALPLLKKIVNHPDLYNYRQRLLEYQMECAEALDDYQTLFKASRAYDDVMREKVATLTNSNFRELQIANAINGMRENVREMEREKRDSEASMQRAIIAVSLCAVVLMAILIVFLFRLYRKNHQLAHNLRDTNTQLKEESDKLRQSRAELIRARDQAQKANNLKSDFIKNMSYEVKVPLQAINEYSHLIADCIAHSSQESGINSTSQSGKHLTRFADMIELNSELLSTIIEDVLSLSEIDSSSLPIQSQVIQLRLLCEATIDSIRHRVHPGVTLTLDPDAPRLELFSDPTRLQQILNNLLTNALKFTEQGSVVLSYRESNERDEVIFSVTDTGIGINPQNKDKIFERFVKLDHNTQGAGLGLTIARMFAQALGGDLKLDTTYTGGARFILNIPRK